ncbi:MAG: HAMP domain-containing sensor histidine kinase [Bacteroidota bacterium]
MKKKNSLVFDITIFILGQLAWMVLLGLWIYLYVSNYLIFEQVGDKLAPQITIDTPNALIFSGGIVLMVAIAVGMSILFRNLGAQIKFTKMYDNFIANITHELKSPLTSIQLYLQTLNSRNVPIEKQKEFLDSMIKDSKRLQKLIDSILEISALEQKRIAHNFEIYNADEVFKRLLNESKIQFKLKDESFIVTGNISTKCIIDPSAIKIAIDNLVDNSIKYSENNVIIKVELSSVNNKIIIKLSDNGIGIPAEEHKRIFKKFHRIYRKDIPNVKGTGLGLYLVKEIMKIHRGKITIQSEGINKGSKFILELPAYDENGQKRLRKLLSLKTSDK